MSAAAYFRREFDRCAVRAPLTTGIARRRQRNRAGSTAQRAIGMIVASTNSAFAARVEMSSNGFTEVTGVAQ